MNLAVTAKATLEAVPGVEVLTRAGFVQAGCWSLVDGVPALMSNPTFPANDSYIYAFVLPDNVVYIGISNGFESRMSAYARVHPYYSQGWNKLNMLLLLHALEAGHRVSVLVNPAPIGCPLEVSMPRFLTKSKFRNPLLA